MCGIAGFWIKNQIAEKEDILSMIRALSHRGPDDEGIYIDKNLALGHRRLAILDLSKAGHQPMENHKFVIVYNGEIYNFKELKKQLAYNFKSNTDTEVVLAAVEKWGIEKALKRFNGMFAFALWDKEEKKLYLARDRLGKKPLYFGVQNNILFFASELKSIYNNSRFHPYLDEDALLLYLKYGYVPSNFSIYKNIKKLPPAHYVVIDKDLKMSLKQYWEIKKITEDYISKKTNIPEDYYLSEIENLLKDSIKKRMIADVEIGAFLSGGIDSTVIVSLMQELSHKPVNTFTIGFFEDDFNEAKYARELAIHLGTQHTELYITPQDVKDVIPELPEIYDEPFADFSSIPTYLLSKLAKREVTVVLSGDGGDELFGGYNRYVWGELIWNKVLFVPYHLRKFLSSIIFLLSPHLLKDLTASFVSLLPSKYQFTLHTDKLYKLANIISSSSIDDFYEKLVSYIHNPLSYLNHSSKYVSLKDTPSIIPSINIKDIKEKMMLWDLLTYLVDDILVKIDRASMAVSLEVRAPFLDYRVVELSKKIPTELKIKNGVSKYVLRKILYKRVQKELIEKPKMEFAVPIERWLRKDLKEWAEELMEDIRKDGIINYKLVRKMWEEHCKGIRN